MALTALLQKLVVAGAEALGRTVVRGLTKAIRRATGDEPDPADATPMTHAAVEHNRRQQESAIAAAKAAEAERRSRITERPPKR